MPYLIRGRIQDDETGAFLYWCNADGWVGRPTATVFPEADGELPLEADGWEDADAPQFEVLLNEQLDADGRHPAWSRGYAPGDLLEPAGPFPLPAAYAALSEEEQCEWIYDWLNADPDQVSTEGRRLARAWRAAGRRSLTVGDLVVVAGSTWACERFGFRHLDERPANE